MLHSKLQSAAFLTETLFNFKCNVQMPNYHFVTICGLNFQFGHSIDALLNISVILQNIKNQKIFQESKKNFFEN